MRLLDRPPPEVTVWTILVIVILAIVLTVINTSPVRQYKLKHPEAAIDPQYKSGDQYGPISGYRLQYFLDNDWKVIATTKSMYVLEKK